MSTHRAPAVTVIAALAKAPIRARPAPLSACRIRDNERTHLARKWSRGVRTVPVDDALDLTTRQAPDFGDEVDVSAGDSLASAKAQASVNALPEFRIGTTIVRGRVSAPRLAGFPQFAP